MRLATLLSLLSWVLVIIYGFFRDFHSPDPLGHAPHVALLLGLIWHFAEIRNWRQFTRLQAVTWWIWSVVVMGLLILLFTPVRWE